MAGVSYAGRVPIEEQDLALLTLAKRLRDAAAEAGRDDVVARTDEVILLLAGRAEHDGTARGRNDTAEVVQRILNGLGF